MLMRFKVAEMAVKMKRVGNRKNGLKEMTNLEKLELQMEMVGW